MAAWRPGIVSFNLRRGTLRRGTLRRGLVIGPLPFLVCEKDLPKASMQNNIIIYANKLLLFMVKRNGN